MQIAGSVVLVTGANRGLGSGFVAGAVEAGAKKVYAAARDPDSLAAVIDAHPGRVVPLKLDVTSADDIANARHMAGDVTVLVNNAGVLERAGIMAAGNLDPLRRELAVNLFGLANMCLAFAPLIEANGGGAIANMLSSGSLRNFPAFGSYGVSKAAAMSLTQCLRFELKDRGIAVVGVYAGFIRTGMTAGIEAAMAEPIEIARTVYRGLEAGLRDIDADESSRKVRAAYAADPVAAENVTWGAATAFLARHPGAVS